MKRGILFLPMLGFVVALSAYAEQYWVAWEGNDFPENEGWTRIHYGDDGPPAERYLNDGIMTLDGRESIEIIDAYRLRRTINPGPGEEFVMEWGLRVNEVFASPLSPYDPGLGVYSDDDWALTFWIGMDRIRSFHEDVVIPFEPGIFHNFEVRSFDMRTYELRIDGAIAFIGSWWEPTFQQSSVTWGDFIRGGASHSDWDYFRFGVVPEPQSLIACAVAVSAMGRLRHRRSMT